MHSPPSLPSRFHESAPCGLSLPAKWSQAEERAGICFWLHSHLRVQLLQSQSWSHNRLSMTQLLEPRDVQSGSLDMQPGSLFLGLGSSGLQSGKLEFGSQNKDEYDFPWALPLVTVSRMNHTREIGQKFWIMVVTVEDRVCYWLLFLVHAPVCNERKLTTLSHCFKAKISQNCQLEILLSLPSNARLLVDWHTYVMLYWRWTYVELAEAVICSKLGVRNPFGPALKF